MAIASRSRFSPTAFLAVLPLLAAAIGTESEAASRGSLGTAVEKAKEEDSDPIPFGSQTKKKGESSGDDSHSSGSAVSVGIYGTRGSGGYESLFGESRRPRMRFFFSVAGGAGGGDAYSFSPVIETAIGFSPRPGLRFDLSGLLASPEFNASTGVEGAFSRMIDPGVGISARAYPQMDSSFIGPYVQVGYRYGRLVWDWANPVRVEEPSGAIEEISGDMLAHHSFYGGVGLSAPIGGAFRGGVGIVGGWREYTSATHERFDNDVFASGIFAELRVELGWMGPEF